MPILKQMLLVALLLSSKLLFATECVKSVFKFPHLQVSLCQNYSSYREVRGLLFKARATALNNYINQQIVLGRFKNIRYDIEIFDPLISQPQLTISKNTTGYKFILSGYPTLQQLAALVTYASHTQTKNLNYSGTNADEAISHFYRQYQPDAKTLNTTNSPAIWAKRPFALIYTGDSLQYRLNNVPLKLPVNGNLPVNMKDRTLFFTGNKIIVYKGTALLRQLVVSKVTSADYDCHTYTDKITICDGGADNWLYAYNYMQNTFIKNPKFN